MIWAWLDIGRRVSVAGLVRLERRENGAGLIGVQQEHDPVAIQAEDVAGRHIHGRCRTQVVVTS